MKKLFTILAVLGTFLYLSCTKTTLFDQALPSATNNVEIPQEGVILNQTFETSLTTGFFYEYPTNNYNAMFREQKDGSTVVKVTLRHDDNEAQYGGMRVELTNNNSSNPDTTHRWWSARYFFPSTYAYDRGDEIIMQWHDKSTNCSTSPAYSIHIIRDSLAVNIRYSTQDYCQYPSSRVLAVNNKGILKLPKDRWFKLQTYYDPYKGKIIVWVDGTQVYEYTGRCHYVGSKHPYFKIGLYKWLWNGSGTTDVSSRQFWMDDVIIARGDYSPTDTTPTDTVVTPPTETNNPPTVSAGPDVTTRSTSVTLDGEARDDKDTVLTNYKWSQTSGPSLAVISSGWNPLISNLKVGTYVFRLTVTDSGGKSAYDEVTVKVTKRGRK